MKKWSSISIQRPNCTNSAIVSLTVCILLSFLVLGDFSCHLLDQMHGVLKQYGTTVKETKKEVNKTIKEVGKVYKDSKKKSDKLKINCKDGNYDEKVIVAIEREKTDLELYKFIVDNSTKKYRKKILGIYKEIDKVLVNKRTLKFPKKTKGRSNVAIHKTPKVELGDKMVKEDEGDLEDSKQTCDAPNSMVTPPLSLSASPEKQKEKVVTFQLNPEFDHPREVRNKVKDTPPQLSPQINKEEEEHQLTSIIDEEEDEEDDAEGDEEICKMLDVDAQSEKILQFPDENKLTDEMKKSIRIERKSFMENRLSDIFGPNSKAAIQFQNYVSES